MLLKKATIDDVYLLQEICTNAYSSNFHDHWEPGGLDWYLEKEFGLERLTKDLNDLDINYFFILQNELPIGFIKTRNSPFSDYLLDSVVELEKIYLTPKKKGSGLGKQALSELVNMVKKWGKRYLFLGVIDTNFPAIAFYEKFGFKFHSRTRLDIPFFKEELKGMHKMWLQLK